MPEDKPDRIQDHTCRIGVDRLLRWVLGQASSSQSKLSRGTDDVFEQPCIMCMLAVCIGKQKLVQVLTCSTCMTAVASQQLHDNTSN